MPSLAFEVGEDPATSDPILAILGLMANVRVGPARFGDFLLTDRVRELPVQGANLVARLQAVPAALTQVGDARHAGRVPAGSVSLNPT